MSVVAEFHRNARSQAPDPVAMLRHLVEMTSDFDGDDPINGAGFIDWFAQVREEVKAALVRLQPDSGP